MGFTILDKFLGSCIPSIFLSIHLACSFLHGLCGFTLIVCFCVYILYISVQVVALSTSSSESNSLVGFITMPLNVMVVKDSEEKMDKVRIITLNTWRLRDQDKRRNIFSYLKRFNADAIFIPEAHLLQEDQDLWQTNWCNRSVIINPLSANSCGQLNLFKGVPYTFRSSRENSDFCA